MKEKSQRYEALVRAMHADVYRYAYWLTNDKATAEDIVQETFLRAWRGLDSLQDEKAAKSWLITILRRENARRFERKQFDLVDIDDMSVSVSSGDSQDSNTEIRQLRRAMANLDEEYRDPLVLQVLFGFSGEEIAQQLNLNKNTVMTRLFRARAQIKEVLAPSQTQRGRQNG